VSECAPRSAIAHGNGDRLEELRAQVQPLLDLSAPADALAAYYALYHDPQRIHRGTAGRRGGRCADGYVADGYVADGYVAVCQTGQRLFQPTVVLRTPDARAAVELLRQALTPGRPYYLITTPDLREAVAEVVTIEQPELNWVFELDLARFQPQINVLVLAERGVSGLPRFVIRSAGAVAAEAGVAWLSPHFAELSVATHPAAQGRGWGRAVVSACTQWVVQTARRPLYAVTEGNVASMALADTVGYVDTGVREYAGAAVCLP